jgi:hypothetical protein
MATKKKTVKKPYTHGGARPNAGRPGTDTEFSYFTVRHEKSIIDKLKRKYPEKGELAAKLRERMDELL